MKPEKIAPPLISISLKKTFWQHFINYRAFTLWLRREQISKSCIEWTFDSARLVFMTTSNVYVDHSTKWCFLRVWNLSIAEQDTKIDEKSGKIFQMWCKTFSNKNCDRSRLIVDFVEGKGTPVGITVCDFVRNLWINKQKVREKFREHKKRGEKLR